MFWTTSFIQSTEPISRMLYNQYGESMLNIKCQHDHAFACQINSWMIILQAESKPCQENVNIDCNILTRRRSLPFNNLKDMISTRKENRRRLYGMFCCLRTRKKQVKKTSKWTNGIWQQQEDNGRYQYFTSTNKRSC